MRIKDTEEWMEVGRVKSDKDEFTEVAIARQRALIAEHAKRLYLVQVSLWLSLHTVLIHALLTDTITLNIETIQQLDSTKCSTRVGLPPF